MPSNFTNRTSSDEEEIQHINDISNILALVGGPILLGCGSVCNILTIVVLRQTTMRRMGASFYLTALTAADLGVVWIGTPRWMSRCLGEDLRKMSVEFCKIHAFLITLCMYSSAWILVLVTIQRVFCVFFPLKSKSLITPRSCAIQLGATLTLLLGVCLNFFWTLDLRETHGGLECRFINEGFQETWGWIDLILGSILPFTSLLICNSMIIAKMYQSRRKMRNDRVENGSDRISRLSLVLVLVSSVFLMCTLPSVISNQVTNMVTSRITRLQYKRMVLVNHVTSWLTLLNSSINFLLYCMVGPVFRQELVTLCYTCTKTPDEMARRRSTFGPASNMTIRTNRTTLKNRGSIRDPNAPNDTPDAIEHNATGQRRTSTNSCDAAGSPTSGSTFLCTGSQNTLVNERLPTRKVSFGTNTMEGCVNPFQPETSI